MAEEGTDGLADEVAGGAADSLEEQPAITVMLRQIPKTALSMNSPFHFNGIV